MDSKLERKYIHDRVWSLNQKAEGITVSSMNIEDGETSQGRSFASPCLKSQLENVFYEKQIKMKFFPTPAEPDDFIAAWQNISTVEGCFKHYRYGRHLKRLSPWTWRSVGHNRPYETLECESDICDWRVNNIHDTLENYSPRLSHIGCTLKEQHVPNNSELLRSELMCATSLMASRFTSSEESDEKGCYRYHRIAPVFVFTFACGKFRVTQAYYDPDEKTFHFSMTDLIDLEHGDVTWFKLVLRWFLNQPQGNTFYPDFKEGKIEAIHTS